MCFAWRVGGEGRPGVRSVLDGSIQRFPLVSSCCVLTRLSFRHVYWDILDFSGGQCLALGLIDASLEMDAADVSTDVLPDSTAVACTGVTEMTLRCSAIDS